jgi:DNA-binding MarR family transcriptional regulator
MVSMETTRAEARSLQRQAAPQLEAHLGYWLRRVSNQVSGAFARALQARHTSVAEWVVMCQLQEQPGMTPAALAGRLELTRGAVSKIVDKLDAKRWVTHSTRPDDGRVQLLSLTRSGRRILPELAEIADRNDREFFDGLSAKEKATLRRLLGKVAELNQIRNVPIL